MLKRSSGIIMHISSLGEKYGIGTLGKEAYKFADFLERAGQTYWQILPLGHTGYGNSPYQCFSAFAGNPYFVDFDILIEDGLLTEEDFVNENFGSDIEKVDYNAIFNTKLEILDIAYQNSKGKLDKVLATFRDTEKSWLEDYTLYMAIKEKMAYEPWKTWPDDIKYRTPEALENYKEELAERIGFWEFVQYEFFKQWAELKTYVNNLGIQIIGDIPIYVAEDGSDAWANSELFKFDADKNPIVVAGCPPDAFSDTGQLWGNPIYDWEYLESTNYGWWIDRISASLKLFNSIRIDHFRGFEAYWEVPYGDKTAENGEWVKGPAMKLINAIKDTLGDVNIIAEDLGFLTPEVLDFLDETGYPGMKVFQFAFDANEESNYIPHLYNKNCIVYTGTHDNDTVMGWINTTGNENDVEHAKNYLKLDPAEGINWGFIRGAWASVGNVAMTQMQDFLGLGNEARMNLPSTLGNNWEWRVKPGALTSDLADRIYSLTKLYGRSKEELVIRKRRFNKTEILKNMERYARVNMVENLQMLLM